MIDRFQTGQASDDYATLIDQALHAFSIDVNYLITILESAQSSQKKKSLKKK